MRNCDLNSLIHGLHRLIHGLHRHGHNRLIYGHNILIHGHNRLILFGHSRLIHGHNRLIHGQVNTCSATNSVRMCTLIYFCLYSKQIRNEVRISFFHITHVIH